MKKLVLLMLFVTSSISLSANNKMQIENKPVTVENVPKSTLCRYWAIHQAEYFGTYGSQSWQSAYLDYYRSCMKERVQ